jgi:hypothetical protein
MKGMEYIAASAVLKAASTLVSVKKVILTATAANAVATFKTGGAAGTTVADIRMETSGRSVMVDLAGTQADYIVLANGVAMVEWN